MMPHPRAVAAGVLAAATLALAACSATTSAPQAQVPTLRGTGSTTQPASATSSSADAGRPRERIDMTTAELQALYDPYNQCLTTHGWNRKRIGTGSGIAAGGADQAAMSRAEAACVSQDPLPPWQIDASNPQAENFVHAVVQCLRTKGVKYVSEEPPEGGAYTWSFGGPQNDAQSISLGLEYSQPCEKQVADQGIGN